MDMNAIHMFVMVVRTGSLSAAAVRLNLPLPTLSRRIRELERELKVELLARSVKGALPTALGMRLYEHANRGIEALLEGEQALISDQASLSGMLRLSLPPGLEPAWRMLAQFQRQYPNISLNVLSTERRVDLTDDGVDVALRVGSIVHENMVARRILRYRHSLVASPALVERYGPLATPADVARFPCGVWRLGDGAPVQWNLGEHMVTPPAILISNEYAMLCNRVMAGDVLAELPPFMAAQAVRAGHLAALLPDYLLPEFEINLLYPAHRHPSSIVRAYLGFCEKHLPGLLLGEDYM